MRERARKKDSDSMSQTIERVIFDMQHCPFTSFLLSRARRAFRDFRGSLFCRKGLFDDFDE